MDISWTSATDGWVLGSAPCRNPTCAAILHTTDGGRSWAGGPAPLAAVPLAGGTQVNCQQVACAALIRMASQSVGYVVGPGYARAPLWLTVNGGRSWTAQPAAQVADLQIADGNVVRLVATAEGCPPGCRYQVQRSTIGADTWTGVNAAEVGGDRVQLIRTGMLSVALIGQNPAGGAGNEQSTVLVSADGGTSWAERPDPCGFPGGQEADAAAVGATPTGDVAVLCTMRMNSSTFIVTSSDAGRTFPERHPLPFTGRGLTILDAQHLLAVGSPNGQSTQAVFRSTDGGNSWRETVTFPLSPTAPSPLHTELGNETPTVARWAPDGIHLFTTTNAGATWTETRY